MRLQGITWGVALAIAGTALVSCGGGGSGGSGGAGGTVSLLTASTPAATTGVAYAMQFAADFPNAPGNFLVAGGQLPTGLTLDPYTGELTGFPRQVGSFHFELAARDGVDLSLPPGRDSTYAEDRQTYTLNVGLGLPNILPQQPPAAQYRAGYAYQIDVAGGTAPFTFVQTGGTLPAGLSVNGTGVIGNFPTATQTLPYEFDVTVLDSHGLSDTEHLSISVVVLPLIILTSNPIQEAAQGFPYDLPITLASGGGGAPYTWSQAPPGPGETLLSSIGMQVTPVGHVSDIGAGPTAQGTFLFTVQVVDEPLQIAKRQFSLKVNPGPVLSNINPKTSSVSGPYTATGLNFQPGAKLKFKPGPTETVVSPTFVNSTKLTFNSPVPKPSNGNGAVPVQVVNPDGGTSTLNAAFVFPASVLAFGTKGFLNSALSSTGLDVADVNGDGFADIVHCGTSGQSVYSGSPTSTNAGLNFHKNLGTDPPTFGTTTLDGQSYYDVKFADVNTDGKLDIVALTASSIRVWIGAGDGTFSVGPTSSQPGGYSWPSEMAIGKFNSDGIPDVAFGVSNWPSAQTNGRTYLMAGNGSGGFTSMDSAITSMPSTYGVISLAACDSDGDGRSEIMTGTGMLVSSGPPAAYSSTTSTGLFNGWGTRGPTVGPPYYASATGLVAGDFLGTGSPSQVLVSMNGSTYSATQVLFLFSGSGLSTITTLTAPATRGKCCALLDGDFDSKMDFVITGTPSAVYVYRGSTGLTQALSLDAANGNPSVASPQVGRVASGDLNGDGAPDIVATTSYWQTNGMAANYGAQYSMANTGNGGSMGIVFWLNSSN